MLCKKTMHEDGGIIKTASRETNKTASGLIPLLLDNAGNRQHRQRPKKIELGHYQYRTQDSRMAGYWAGNRGAPSEASTT
jgi:hypothetical protein